MSFGADGVVGRRVPEDNVCVTPWRENAFARIHAEDARGGGGNQFHEAIDRQLSLIHPMVMDQLQPVFDAGTTVRNLGEIVLAEYLLILETKWAMVCGNHLQMVVFESVLSFSSLATGA